MKLWFSQVRLTKAKFNQKNDFFWNWNRSLLSFFSTNSMIKQKTHLTFNEISAASNDSLEPKNSANSSFENSCPTENKSGHVNVEFHSVWRWTTQLSFEAVYLFVKKNNVEQILYYRGVVFSWVFHNTIGRYSLAALNLIFTKQGSQWFSWWQIQTL